MQIGEMYDSPQISLSNIFANPKIKIHYSGICLNQTSTARFFATFTAFRSPGVRVKQRHELF